MIVAVLSDAHDNIWNVEAALPHLADADMMIFCGDFCAPFTLKMLADGFDGPVHCVLGNNDGDALLLAHIANQADNVTLYQGMGELAAGDAKLAFAHYPQIGKALAQSGQYAAVFSGHSHRQDTQRIGDTLWVNPGEVMGRYGEPGFALYDTKADKAKFVRL